MTATGLTRKPSLPRTPIRASSAAAPARVAPASFRGKTVATGYYRWEDLVPGSVASGPAIVAGGQATAVVPPGLSFRIDELGNLIATRTPISRARRRTEAAMAAAG